MPRFIRYAIYAAPAPGPLADFGAAWLGWDAARGVAMPHPALPGLPRPVAEITVAPRRYGLHGTLKPPFRLAEGSSRQTLEADLAALARRLAPIALDRLRLGRLGRFLALLPEGDTTALEGLATACVRDLDAHRAPPTVDDLARRRGKGLTPSQDTNLRRWGYPFVMRDFRFHLTLTGRLPRPELDAVEAALARALTPLLPRPCLVADLCLFGEAPDGFFHLLSRHPLGG